MRSDDDESTLRRLVVVKALDQLTTILRLALGELGLGGGCAGDAVGRLVRTEAAATDEAGAHDLGTLLLADGEQGIPAASAPEAQLTAESAADGSEQLGER